MQTFMSIYVYLDCAFFFPWRLDFPFFVNKSKVYFGYLLIPVND